MLRHEFATAVLVAAALLTGCAGDNSEIAFSQQGAISADMDASFQHGPSVTDHETAVQFNNGLDNSINNRPPPLGSALGFR
ncbi:MAG TPA: hypothetical protein VL993_19060 [Stellaceae bacterium]|nr:hypothetical protein [Stellaceae bacterium]